jgi:D-alanyl-D-alanine carboxypeptidase
MAALRCYLGSVARPVWAMLAALALLIAVPQAARAQIGSDRYSSIVIDAATGSVLEQANPDALRHPASLTKLMTLYLVFEALRDRRISLNELVPVSEHTASMEPTKLGLVPGSHITVQQAILGLVTKSANDAAAALGELLGGSEERFAQMMTLRARAMGMAHTTFTNASGLPDPNQWSTARDLALLGRRLVSDFPSDYHYFSTPSFVFNRQYIANHDHLLNWYPGADGMKTGYTEASGCNLVTSAVNGGVRLIGVVLGASTGAERDVHMGVLLDQGFAEMGVTVPRRGNTTTASRTPSLVSSAHAATVAEARADVPVSGWGIQVGSYGAEKTAREVAQDARRAAGGGNVRIEHVTVRGTPLWRAQVMGLTEARAQGACSQLAHERTTCVLLKPGARQVASR